ncbi:cysteine hydrolase family protein [Glycomyces albidus]|uniref:Isochorismatase family protein n=1 Tax=Glycomyces albidus TaxID=2656774 RepID=A0A6L5G735_9ACTN|nr:isochorismatase family protein [Glycomyces albidus]MQM25464.1 isochorismatase family protein [Glycomyces albidus]
MQIDSRSGALILIDLMPRIIALDTAPRTGADVRDRCLALADRARAAGASVVWVRVERPNVDEQPPGSGLDEACAPLEGEPVVVKRALSAFHETGLHALLTARGVATVVIAGLVTTFGVESTARTAADYGYEVVLPTDAMAAFSAEAHTFAEKVVFPSIGTVCASDELEFG